MSELFLQLWPYLSIVLFMIATGCGLPLPEEVAIVSAGIGSANGTLDPSMALASCLVGGLLGDMAMYGIGYKCFGWVKHHPRVARLLHVEREKQMEKLIARHGFKFFFVARFMVGVRGPLYIASGMLKIPFRRFIFVDLFCASTVIGLFFGLSYYFGGRIFDSIRTAEWWLTGILIGVLAVVLLVCFVRYRRGRSLVDRFDSDVSQQTADSTDPASQETPIVK